MDRIVKMHIKLAASCVGVPAAAMQPSILEKGITGQLAHLIDKVLRIQISEELIRGRRKAVPMIAHLLYFDRIVVFIPRRPIERRKLPCNRLRDVLPEKIVNYNITERFSVTELR